MPRRRAALRWRALRIVRALDAGTVWVNRYGRTNDFMIPTGGFRRSGPGKDPGRQGDEAHLRFKSVLIDTRGQAAVSRDAAESAAGDPQNNRFIPSRPLESATFADFALLKFSQGHVSCFRH